LRENSEQKASGAIKERLKEAVKATTTTSFSLKYKFRYKVIFIFLQLKAQSHGKQEDTRRTKHISDYFERQRKNQSPEKIRTKDDCLSCREDSGVYKFGHAYRDRTFW
jgi:hypothetical protein